MISRKKQKSKSRAPQGARGLKYQLSAARGFPAAGRAPQGARGLKFDLRFGVAMKICRRAPQGARGLKCLIFANPSTLTVAPRKGRVG